MMYVIAPLPNVQPAWVDLGFRIFLTIPTAKGLQEVQVAVVVKKQPTGEPAA
jgi:hypothetical protein